MRSLTFLMQCNIQSVKITGIRSIVTSSCLYGRKFRKPWDERFPINPKDVAPHREGGRAEFLKKLVREIDADRYPAPPGYYDKDGNLVVVKEMVPEFVVPDLTGFKLKPYVSYRVPSVKQSEFTAKDLFDACYAKDITEAVISKNEGKVNKLIGTHLKEDSANVDKPH